MSEELKKKKPNPERITVRQVGQQLTYGGPLVIKYNGVEVARIEVDLNGTPLAPEHNVRVWISTECEVCESLSPVVDPSRVSTK